VWVYSIDTITSAVAAGSIDLMSNVKHWPLSVRTTKYVIESTDGIFSHIKFNARNRSSIGINKCNLRKLKYEQSYMLTVIHVSNVHRVGCSQIMSTIVVVRLYKKHPWNIRLQQPA
jgi:hypothetical protein